MARLYENMVLTRRRHRRLAIVCAFCCVLVAAVLFFFVQAQQRSSSEQARQQVQQTVIDTATQCYAIEGAYPTYVSYLEDNYGLRINRSVYIVSYETIGSNVAPTVEVLVRGR